MSPQQRRLEQAIEVETAVTKRYVQLVEHQQHRGAVLAQTHHSRAELASEFEAVDDALNRTRPDRVQALSQAPSDQLLDLLSVPPQTVAAQNLWPRLADIVETHLDRHPPHGPPWHALCGDLRAARKLMTDPPPPLDRPTPRRPAEANGPRHSQTKWHITSSPEIPANHEPDLGL